jgi:CRISPR-associated protein Cas1
VWSLAIVRVQAAGLHPHFGCLHVPSVRHAALVSDLVEEFRAPIVDSLVLTLVNRGDLTLKDFAPPDGRGAVLLLPQGLKVFLKQWQARLNTRVVYPELKERVTYLRVLELQVWEYVEALSGDREMYRPFLSKF